MSSQNQIESLNHYFKVQALIRKRLVVHYVVSDFKKYWWVFNQKVTYI